MMRILDRKWFTMLLVAVLLTTALPPGTGKISYAAECDGVTPGTTTACPIMIYSADDLNEMRDNLEAHYALGADIDLFGGSWEPVGALGGTESAFRGSFNGNGYTISNLTINSSAGAVGLFGAANHAVFHNIGLINVQISGTGSNSGVGSLVGDLISSTVANSYATGTVEGIDNVGGLIGYASGSFDSRSYLASSYTAVVVNGSGSVVAGGLIGVAEGYVESQGVSYYNIDTAPYFPTFGTPLTTEEMKSGASFSSWDLSLNGRWAILEELSYPMHRTTYDRILLENLTVDAGDIAIDPLFAGHEWTYTSRVTGDVDSVTVAAVAGSDNMSISIDGEAEESKQIELDPGDNTISITVETGLSVPGAAVDPFVAEYSLNIVRENGTDYPHRITTTSQLAMIGTAPFLLIDNYELMNDLDLTGLDWEPIGDGGQPFAGIFEGHRHVIRNLTVAQPEDDAGLFGASSGTIRNIGLENASVSGGSRVGGLVGGNSGSVLNAYVKGSIVGDEFVGGLIGASSGTPIVSGTYFAGTVSGEENAGGLIGGGTAGTVSSSYWDTEISGLQTSAGGEGKTTAEMKQAATYSGWDFAGTWAMMNETVYPMFIRQFDAVKLQALTAASTDAIVNWTPETFASDQGEYALTADRYIQVLDIAATPADVDAEVTIAGTAASSAQIPLAIGSNEVLVETVGASGSPQGVYRLMIEVPVPLATDLDIPSAGYYGIGQTLAFTVSYEGDIAVSGTPQIPVVIGEGAEATTVYAVYTGQPAGEDNKLIFAYVVQEGLIHVNDITLGSQIQLADDARIYAAGTNASIPLDLPAASTTGIVIDSIRPTITLSSHPSGGASTGSPVTITAVVDGTGTDIVATKWSEGEREADYFATEGLALAGDAFEVTANGIYSVYAEDEAGNSHVATIQVGHAGSGSGGSVPPISPTVEIDASGGITVVIPSSLIVKKTLEDGTVVEQVTLSDAIMQQVLSLLGKAQEPFVSIVIDDSGQVVELQIAGANLNQVKEAHPLAVFETRLNASSYQMHVNTLQTELPTSNVMIYIGKVSGQEKAELEQAANDAGLKLLGAAIDFRLSVTAGGQTAEIIDFGRTYINRSIVLDESSAGNGAIAVLYDPITGEFSFVPVVFDTRADGKLEANMKSPHNSIYAIAVPARKSFVDLDQHWAKSDVERLASRLIVNGVTSTEFAPGSTITRAEFTALLVRALGLKVEGINESSVFNDVSADDWFAPVIAAGVKAGLVSGISTDEFAPDVNVTREQMAVMFRNALVFLGYPETPAETAATVLGRFEDRTAISSWAKSAVAQSAAAGIIHGVAEGQMAPGDYATRAQAVVMLRRFLQFVDFID